MKKIISIAFFILISSVSYAEQEYNYQAISDIPKQKNIDMGVHTATVVSVRTVCLNGYLFVIAKSAGANGVSIVQIYGNSGRPLATETPKPIKCKG